MVLKAFSPLAYLNLQTNFVSFWWTMPKFSGHPLGWWSHYEYINIYILYVWKQQSQLSGTALPLPLDKWLGKILAPGKPLWSTPWTSRVTEQHSPSLAKAVSDLQESVWKCIEGKAMSNGSPCSLQILVPVKRISPWYGKSVPGI